MGMSSLNRLAPVVLFTYKRVDTLELAVGALRQNFLAKETDLFIFSDGFRKEAERVEVNNLRAFLHTIDGFRSVTIHESEGNKGLARSVIDGVTQVINQYQRAIVLEDDLLTSPNFLTFMNAALSRYKQNKNVLSISGYSMEMNYRGQVDVYFTKRSTSWGWATWKDRWEKVDWEVSNYGEFLTDNRKQRNFNKMGSDLATMLKKQMRGQMNSWAIRWVYHQFERDLFSVYPTISKVQNIGFGGNATHTFDYFNRYRTTLDNTGRTEFHFTEPHLDPGFLRKFLKIFSVRTRLWYKILNSLRAFIVRNKASI